MGRIFMTFLAVLGVTGFAMASIHPCMQPAASGADASVHHLDRHQRDHPDPGVSGVVQEINDREIAEYIDEQGERLCDEDKARLTTELLEERRDVAVVALAEPQTRDLPLTELYEARRKGVLVMRMLYKCDRCPHWHSGGSGTAFVISADGVCVTNYHMFEAEKSPHPPRAVLMDTNGVVFSVKEVLAADQATDIAIFRLGDGLKEGEPVDVETYRFDPIPLANQAPVGMPVALIAHPDGEHYTLTTGVVMRRSVARRGINGDLGRRQEVPALTVSCEFAVGSSGGPIMDMRGQAVGMVCNTHTVYAGEGKSRSPQMVMRRCTPSDQILALIISPPPSPDDKAK